MSAAKRKTFSCLDAGSMVLITTCFHDTYEGQVIAFNENSRMILMSEIDDDENTMHFINLALCSNLELLEEATEDRQMRSKLAAFNYPRLQMRCERAVEMRAYKLASENPKASQLARELFAALMKIYPRPFDVIWCKKSMGIIVLNELKISEPYEVEQIKLLGESSTKKRRNHKAFDYLRKLVQRFHDLRCSKTEEKI